MNNYLLTNITPTLVVGGYSIFSVLRVIIHCFDLFPLFHFKKVDYSKTKNVS